jgi:dTMP kinase
MLHLRGKFIVFDGNEGCGKSTQAHLARAEIEKAGIHTILVRDPGTTRIGEMIRAILLDPQNNEIAPRCEMLLFMAARSQMMRQTILPALREDACVISDRFVSSTLAYQLGGDGLTEAEILAVGKAAVHEHWPDMTILFDLPVEMSMARTRPKFTLFPDDPVAGAEKDRIERRSLEYHEMVRQNYLRQAKNHRRKYHVVDASREVEPVHADVMRLLASLQ